MNFNSIFFENLEIILDQNSKFKINFVRNQKVFDQVLVLDIYDLNNHVHPEGHIGWWSYDIQDVFEGEINIKNGFLSPNSSKKIPLKDSWVNKNIKLPEEILLMAVLRDKLTNKIISKAEIPILKNKLLVEKFRSKRNSFFYEKKYFISNEVLSRNKKIFIVSNNIFLNDAVGNLCYDLYHFLQNLNIDVSLYAGNFDLHSNDLVNKYERIFHEDTSNCTLIYFYSIFDINFDLLTGQNFKKKILYFHNITNPKHLQVFSTELSVECRKSFSQISNFKFFDQILTNSDYTKDCLLSYLQKSKKEHESKKDRKFDRKLVRLFSSSKSVPPFISSNFNIYQSQIPFKNTKEFSFLFVGRIESSKKIEDIISFFHEFLKLQPNSKLRLVGSVSNKAYYSFLKWFSREKLGISENRINWLQNLTTQEIKDLYLSSTIYISMSADEGFCIPIFDAMNYMIPVMAFDIPAIREVTDSSAILFKNKDFPYLASFIYKVFENEIFINDLITQQKIVANNIINAAKGLQFIRAIND